MIDDRKTAMLWQVDLSFIRGVARHWSSSIISQLAKPHRTRLIGEGTWIITGQIAAAVGGFLGVPVLAHFLRPEEYGRLALGGTVMALVQQASMGPIGSAVQRFYSPSVEAKILSDYLRATAAVILTATAVIAMAGLLVVIVMANSRWHSSVALAAWSLMFAIFSGFHIVFDGIQNAARQRSIVAWHQGLSMWLRFAVAALLVRAFGGAEMAMAGFAAANAATLVSQAVFFRRAILSSPAYRPEFSPEVTKTLRRQIWIYARSVSSWGLFTWTQLASDRWALEAFTTTRAVGLYQAVYQLGYYPISMASTFLNQLVTPILFARVGAGNDEERVKTSHHLVNVLFAACVVLTVVGTGISALICKPLFNRFFPPTYGADAFLLPAISLAAGIFAAGQVACLKHILTLNPQSLIVPKIATAVMGTAFNVAGAYSYGTAGVVAANLCFSTVFAVWVFALKPSPASSA